MKWLLYRDEADEDVVTLLRRGAFVSELHATTPTEAIGELVRALGVAPRRSGSASRATLSSSASASRPRVSGTRSRSRTPRSRASSGRCWRWDVRPEELTSMRPTGVQRGSYFCCSSRRRLTTRRCSHPRVDRSSDVRRTRPGRAPRRQRARRSDASALGERQAHAGVATPSGWFETATRRALTRGATGDSRTGRLPSEATLPGVAFVSRPLAPRREALEAVSTRFRTGFRRLGRVLRQHTVHYGSASCAKTPCHRPPRQPRATQSGGRKIPALDHGVIGNGRVPLALVSPTSAVEWLCLPRFDSPSIFARLLDARNGGKFRLLAGSEECPRQPAVPREHQRRIDALRARAEAAGGGGRWSTTRLAFRTDSTCVRPSGVRPARSTARGSPQAARRLHDPRPRLRPRAWPRHGRPPRASRASAAPRPCTSPAICPRRTSWPVANSC